jgi:tight adherence protein C
MLTWAIPVLVFISVITLGGAVVALMSRRGAPTAERLADSTVVAGEAPQQRESKIAGALHRLGSAVSASTKLKETLARAGYYQEMATTIFLGIKLSLLFVALAAIPAIVLITKVPPLVAIPAVVTFGVALFFTPNLIVAMKQRRRTVEVRRHLPDAVDLLEVCVSAGMGMDSAWNSVSDEIRNVCPVLSDEMTLTSLEIHLGAQRTTAMRNMAKRAGADELMSLVALLAQAERFGTSVKDALREFASSMRDMRSQRAEEAAEKMPVKLLFPLVLCIFPVMLIVLVGPAGITLARVISGGQ